MRRYDGLEKIYTKIPKIECKGLCHQYCGIIPMSRMEMTRIVESVGMVPQQEEASCPLLDSENRCSQYSIRPSICRIWGLVKRMQCPYGCLPERFLADSEARLIINEVNALSLQDQLEYESDAEIEQIAFFPFRENQTNTGKA